jgi:hypothetical protein
MHAVTYDQDYLQRKLDHYNKWLLDPKRTPGVPYAGFPEEVKMEKARAKLAAEYIAKAKAKAEAPAKVKATKAKRARKAGSGPSKIDRAVELYKANIKLSKDNMIALLREELDMSLAGATTYYYNAKKAA